MTEICHIQGVKCVKCNRPYLTSYHYHFAWYCKANNKLNSPRPEIKKSKLCSHSFKYLNYKDNHQADLIKYHF